MYEIHVTESCRFVLTYMGEGDCLPGTSHTEWSPEGEQSTAVMRQDDFPETGGDITDDEY